MADALYDLLKPHLENHISSTTTSESDSKYLSRLVSLRLSDLTTTEPQSLAQSSQSNLVSIQALSSRSHRTTTTSSDHLSTLRQSLPLLSSSVGAIRTSIPTLDNSAVQFASSYSKSKDENVLLKSRKDAALLARQADKAQDILDLPNLLSAAIASAGTASTAGSALGGANYSQALDLYAHIKRLQILYPDSQLVKSVLTDAEVAMRDMTTNLIASLKSQNIRLAAAIRTIGWLRRVAPELGTNSSHNREPAHSRTTPLSLSTTGPSTVPNTATQGEGHFGALFLCARLATFLSMTEALSPLRDLADQETAARISSQANPLTTTQLHDTSRRPHLPTRKSSSSGTGRSTYNPALQGQQTERYLKRYIEIFREQSFATISMYRNIFQAEDEDGQSPQNSTSSLAQSLTLPPALASFPLHLVSLFTETLQEYLPNVTDPTARESLLMQVLYAANSLGRLGADFSLIIALLEEEEEEEDEDEEETAGTNETEQMAAEKDMLVVDKDLESTDIQSPAANGDESSGFHDPNDNDSKSKRSPIPEVKEAKWVTIIKKHRVQSARLEALAAGQEQRAFDIQRRTSSDILPIR